MDNLKKVKEIKEYEKSLKEKTAEELRAMEQELIAEAEKVDKEVSDTEYDLPKDNWKAVCQGIRLMLNKKTVEWKFALSFVSMFDFWDPENYPKKVKYPMLDATLRTLGELQFTGYEEWAAVVAVNKYFETIRPLYVETVEKVFDIASKHNAIMDELKLKSPVDAAEIPDSIPVK